MNTTKYEVITKDKNGNEKIEAVRTSREAAQKDVELLKQIAGKKTASYREV